MSLVDFPHTGLTFDDHTHDRDDLHAFWSALDVLPELCDMLADRGVMWYCGKFHVLSAYKSDRGLLHSLYSACLTVFRFKKFSSSRWLTIGTSMRTLVTACALGLRGLLAFTLADPCVSSYYIGGFSRLTGPMLQYAAIASVAYRPCKALSMACC